MKVLIADDNIVSLHALKALVEKSGCEVIIVDNGMDAYEFLTGEHGPQRIWSSPWGFR